VIDPDGYRPNVGIVLMRQDGQVFWARRVRRDGWQFPQGGMNTDETPVEAMYRELHEETGLLPEHVEVLGATPGWLRYRLPARAIRRNERQVCIGQKQVWFLLRLAGALPVLRWSQWPLRLLVLVGLLLFVAVAAACAWFGAGWLQYPSGWAKPLILVIEAAATLSIAASLSLLVIGDETETER